MKRHRKRKLREAKADAKYVKLNAFFIYRIFVQNNPGRKKPHWWRKYARAVMRLQA